MASKNIFKKVVISSDHAGFHLKSFLVESLQNLGFSVLDLGCHSAEKSVDYPDYANILARNMDEKTDEKIGILICGSGVGISIAANRFNHIRAALCNNAKIAKLARSHNDANVLCLGARLISNSNALKIVKTFINQEFEGGRHILRIAKLSDKK